MCGLVWWSSWRPSVCPAGVDMPGSDVLAWLCVHKPLKSHQGQAWALTLSPQFLVLLSLPWLCFITWTQREPLLCERSQTSEHSCHNVEMRQLQEMRYRVSSSCWTSPWPFLQHSAFTVDSARCLRNCSSIKGGGKRWPLIEITWNKFWLVVG